MADIEVIIKIPEEMYKNIDEPCNDEDLLRYIIKQGRLSKDILTCEDVVSRKEVLALAKEECETAIIPYKRFVKGVNALPPVTPKQRLCKDCKFFEYDCILAEVDGIPLVAHEICNKWGDGCKTGCKTKEDGYCFLFEPMEGERNVSKVCE